MACSDTFLRAMDEFNAGMGGQRTCTKEAHYDTDSYDGYSYKTGGLCNIWQGQIRNYSDYTIKCDNTINGNRANTIYASPRKTTELKQIGYMSGQLKYNCKKWARDPYVWKSYSKRNYQILVKRSSGKNYLTVKNNSNKTRSCFIKNKNKKVLAKANLAKGGALNWIRSPNGNFYTNCL